MEFYDLIVAWALIFSRLTAMLYFLPVFGGRTIPRLVKVLFAMSISLSFLVAGNFVFEFSSVTTSSLLLAIILEVVNGITIGFAATVIMNSIYIAGHLIDMNMGFGMVNVMSANNEARVPITANFYYMFTVMIFFLVDAHHNLIDAFALSLQKLPLGAVGFNMSHVASYTELITSTFVLGFKLAMPIILTVLISNLILGLLSKAMPGMNVFMVGMPFKILIGFFTLLLVAPAVYNLFFSIIDSFVEFIYSVVARFYL